MRIMKKGDASVIFLIGTLIGAFFIFFDFSPAYAEANYYRVTLHTHMSGMSNAIDGAELYASTSLDYSAYQAIYETLKKGGLGQAPPGEGGLAYWSTPDSDISIPEKEEVTEAVRERTEANLAKYLSGGYSFTTDYKVMFPDYSILLSEKGGSVSAKTTSDDGNLTIRKKLQEYGMIEDVELKRTFLPEASIDIDYGSMLEQGKVLKTGIEGQLPQALKGEADSWEKVTEAIPDLEALENGLREALEANQELIFQRSEGIYTLNSSVHRVLVTRASSRNSDGSYTNTYTATAVIRVEVTDNREYYPVYDFTQNKIVMDQMALTFLIKDQYSTA